MLYAGTPGRGRVGPRTSVRRSAPSLYGRRCCAACRHAAASKSDGPLDNHSGVLAQPGAVISGMRASPTAARLSMQTVPRESPPPACRPRAADLSRCFHHDQRVPRETAANAGSNDRIRSAECSSGSAIEGSDQDLQSPGPPLHGAPSRSSSSLRAGRNARAGRRVRQRQDDLRQRVARRWCCPIRRAAAIMLDGKAPGAAAGRAGHRPDESDARSSSRIRIRRSTARIRSRRIIGRPSQRLSVTPAAAILASCTELMEARPRSADRYLARASRGSCRAA